MIVFNPQFREYYTGYLNITADVQKPFKYSIYTDKVKQWSTPIKNTIATQKRFVIRTSWNLPFRVNQQVVLSGERYKISRCTQERTVLNEQVATMWKNGANIYWLIEVVA